MDNVDLHVEKGERVCLVGRNGTGKSSLMKLLYGELTPDTGEIHRAPGEKIGYMGQDVPTSWQGPVFGVVAAGLGQKGEILAALHLASMGMDHLVPSHLQGQIQGMLDSGEGWEQHGEVLGIINQLQLDPDALFQNLSGGSKRRATLARALLASENLLLDEPTNHLDIGTTIWLEDFLLRRAKTLFFISHDRMFAERLATRVVEVDRAKIYSYDGSFAAFVERREERLTTDERHNALFDKKLAQEEVWIRQGIKARRTRNMGRVRALEALRSERAARLARTGSAKLVAQEAERSGKMVIEVTNASFSYPDGYKVLTDVSAIIQRGDRIGIVGNNGTGKTTLLKLLLDELQPTSGAIRHGTRLNILYFDQLRAKLDPEVSVMDSIADGNDAVIIDGNQRHVAGYLRDFLFESHMLRVPVKTLSGGERHRLLLAKLFTKPSNVLVMDEPTNDLDMETLELLEEMLAGYGGTVLMVSHDRRFLDNLVTGILALEGDGHVRSYVGGYTDWLRQREPLEKKAESIKAAAAPASVKKPAQDKLSFKELREKEELTKELEQLPNRLATLEAEQQNFETTLADPNVYARDPNLFEAATKGIVRLADEEQALLERWEYIEERLTVLNAKKG